MKQGPAASERSRRPFSRPPFSFALPFPLIIDKLRDFRTSQHYDKEQKAAIPGPLPFVWIEVSRIQLRKKHRPGFLSESGATGSVKLMFYANGQLLV